MKHLKLTALALASCASLLVGCAGIDTKPVPALVLQNPETTPREKWSDAMIILRGDMGIYNQMDIPAEKAAEVGLVETQGDRAATGSSGTPGDLAIGYSGYQSPPSGFSSGAALGMGVAMFLLPTGPVSQPYNASQVAAWVPADQASSMDEAIALAERTLRDARHSSLSNPGQLEIAPAGKPDLNPRNFKSLSDVVMNRPIRPEGEAGPAPSFLTPGRYYGPIFFTEFSNQISIDAMRSDLTKHDALAKVSAELPQWMVLYNPGLKAQRNMPGYPPSIMLKGQEYFFVGK